MSSCQKQKMLRQACVIPYRQGDNGQWEVCLVTSIRKRRWIFPKGLVDEDETIAETGRKEAWEEAGVHGHVVGPVVAQYTDYKWGAQLDVDVMNLLNYIIGMFKLGGNEIDKLTKTCLDNTIVFVQNSTKRGLFNGIK